MPHTKTEDKVGKVPMPAYTPIPLVQILYNLFVEEGETIRSTTDQSGAL